MSKLFPSPIKPLRFSTEDHFFLSYSLLSSYYVYSLSCTLYETVYYILRERKKARRVANGFANGFSWEVTNGADVLLT